MAGTLNELRALLTGAGAGSARIPPTATYRLQFHAGFTFLDAAQLVPYLHALGVSDLYASPYLRARSGSTHGYDVADPNALNPELGTAADYDALAAALAAHGMGQLVDVVPNHMGIGDPGNTRWLDVLENGPASVQAPVFDINWNPLKPELHLGGDRNKVILPVLGDQYGTVLENGELRLGYDEGAFFVAYYDHRFPVAPDTYPHILQPCLDELVADLGTRNPHAQELASILTALRHLPPRDLGLEATALEERNREKEIVKRRLRALYEASPRFRQALDLVLNEFNRKAGEPRERFDRLDALLAEQSYRLAFWRVAAEEINYRRFFDINELAAVRMEDPRVFQETHRLLLRLVGEGKISGLRIDHPDGLLDPARYFADLQRSCFVHLHASRIADHPEFNVAHLELLYDRERARNPRSPLLKPVYVVAEKILSVGEHLPPDWLVHGTTGYDFMNVLNGIFVERDNEQFFDNIYGRFIRSTTSFHDLANSTRKMVMLISLASEVNELGYLVKRVASSDRRYRDFTLNSLTFVIREIIAALPVYRTYVDPTTGASSPTDHEYLDVAVAEAKRRNPRTDPSIFDFVRDTLLGTVGEENDETRALRMTFLAKFQQTTGPVMAKGLEDTAFYVYNRLVSLNEVGGEPEHFGVSLAGFHRHNQARLKEWPASLLSTSTHDTKRSEDVRARINVLSELPREWQASLTRWSRLNGRKKGHVGGRTAPDRNEEYLLYQILLGAWPLEPLDEAGLQVFIDRACGFMQKAMREAKVNSSWINPNDAYEAAVLHFVQVILRGDDESSRAFLDDFRQLCQRVTHVGLFNSLSQTLLKLTCPGVPDIYQGAEIWDFSLVDPDNRRPVDFHLRGQLLRDIKERVAQETERAQAGQASTGALAAFARELVAQKEDGRIKLYVTHRTLALRREHPAIFAAGSTYTPLRAEGPKEIGSHVCAFARSAGRGATPTVVVAAPVLIAGLTGSALVPPLGADVWRDARLPLPGKAGRRFRDVFTGTTHETTTPDGKAGLHLADVFRDFPVSLLVEEG